MGPSGGYDGEDESDHDVDAALKQLASTKTAKKPQAKAKNAHTKGAGKVKGAPKAAPPPTEPEAPPDDAVADDVEAMLSTLLAGSDTASGSGGVGAAKTAGGVPAEGVESPEADKGAGPADVNLSDAYRKLKKQVTSMPPAVQAIPNTTESHIISKRNLKL